LRTRLPPKIADLLSTVDFSMNAFDQESRTEMKPLIKWDGKLTVKGCLLPFLAIVTVIAVIEYVDERKAEKSRADGVKEEKQRKQTWEDEEEAQRKVALEVRVLAEPDYGSSVADVPLVGKALVWDLENNRSWNHFYRQSFRDLPENEPATVFLITRVTKEHVGYYAAIGQSEYATRKAYRRIFRMCIVAWPERKRIGFYTFIDEPPKTIPASDTSNFIGSGDFCIYDWIQTLPRRAAW